MNEDTALENGLVTQLTTQQPTGITTQQVTYIDNKN